MLRRLIPYTCATVAIVAALVAMLPAVSTGAGASILIQANIVSATSLTNGCTSPIGFQFGTVQPGSNLTTATTAGACRFTFGSTNDSASLRIGQRDGSGTAMGRSATSWIGSQDATITSNDAIALTISAGWTVGPNGIMQRTLDGGTSWTQYGVALTGTGDWLTRAAVEAGSTTTFYTAGGNGNVTKVTNATSTTPTFTNYVGVLAFPAGSVVRGIYSPATNVVFIVATNGSTVYVSRSGTGGTSFAAPFILAGATRAIDMGGASASDFWIVGSGATSGIFRTTTGGATPGAWSELASPNRYWSGISMSATNNGYLIGSGGEVWRWNGTVWSQAASPSSLTMRSVAAVPGSPLVAWVAGTNADAYRTIDGGTTWTRVDSGTSAYLWGIASVDSTHAILAGDDRWVGWTNDGTTIAGSTQDAASYTMADVASSPTNGQVLVSVGGAGLIRRSTNMGSSWTTIPSGTTRSLRSIAFSSTNVGWAVGEAGTVLRTTNGGTSWTSQSVNQPLRLSSVAVVDDLHAWAAGDDGYVVHTSNGGATWTDVISGVSWDLLDVAAWDDSTVTIAARGSAMMYTTNAGATWTAPAVTPNAGIAIVSVEYVNATTLYAATNFRDVWKTTNGGANWAVTSGTPSSDDITSMHVLDDQRIVIAGGYQKVQVSLDAGATWTVRPVATDQMLGFTVVDENTIIGVGRINGQASTTASITANETVADYGGAPSTWAGSTTGSLFGVCVQSLGGTASIGAGWAADGGTCTTSDTDPWKAIPSAMTTIATTTTAGTGSADLVWGVRFGTATAPGRYTATIAVEVIAPSA